MPAIRGEIILFAASSVSMRVVFPWSTWPRVVNIRTFAESGACMLKVTYKGSGRYTTSFIKLAVMGKEDSKRKEDHRDRNRNHEHKKRRKHDDEDESLHPKHKHRKTDKGKHKERNSECRQGVVDDNPKDEKDLSEDGERVRGFKTSHVLQS